MFPVDPSISRPSVLSEETVPGVLVDRVEALLADARACRQRRTLIVTGGRKAGIVFADGLIRVLGRSACWYSDQAPQRAQTCFGRDAFKLLGTEIDWLVFDAYAGFDPDAFGALTGSIRAGGLLLLIAPPLRDWAQFNDPENRRITVAPFDPAELSGRFLKRLANVLADDATSLLVESGRLVREAQIPVAVEADEGAVLSAGPCRTRDQQTAVDALMKVATGHRRRPVVLISDRGRGKSAAFGIAAAQLIAQGKKSIVVTAPRLQSVDSLLNQAERLQPGARESICFVPPDELARQERVADLLLVDEAAAIPTPILERLLRRYPRIAFATTVHGYEGTGRGFALRFTRILDRLTNSWKTVKLETPIRWAENDPLEALVFRLLALDAEPAAESAIIQDMGGSDYRFECLDRDQLVEDGQALSELFGLLVQAHYRTRPLDLRHLLDGPNLEVYVLRSGRHIVATALLAIEGGFDPVTAEAIWAGRHRPHGHLLPETLAAHQGLMEAPCLQCGRIMRVTVHPALQRRGLGRRLVNEITAGLASRGFDFIGTSFGASPELLDFWNSLEWRPVRLSIQKSASSGSHSSVFIRALSEHGIALQAKARQRFFAQFPHQLSDSLRDLDAAVIMKLLARSGRHAPVPDKDDRSDLRAFASEQRLAEVSIGSLWRLALHALMTGQAQVTLQRDELALMIVRVLQKNSWSECAARCGLSGRKQALQMLRVAVRKLLD